MNLCPKCQTEMHGCSIYVWDRDGGKVMSWYDMHECVCIGCKETFGSVEKMNVCLPCFEAQVANEDK